MNRRAFLLAAASLLFTGTSLLANPPASPASGSPPASAPAAKPTLFTCGDSTCKNSGNGKNGQPVQGWGTPIAQFFDPAKVTVNNVGHAGTSSLTYYQGDWPRVLPQIKKGDFVLIVFGINDGGLQTPNGIGDEVTNGRAGAQTHTYGWYMSKMATDAREKGARPYFLTVTTRNIWNNPKVKFNDATPIGALPADYDPKLDKIERGTGVDPSTGQGRYTQWTKEVGKKINVPVFDLTNYCADLYEKMGREEVNKLYSDHNHTYVPGALIVAQCIASGLKSFKDSPFEPLMNDKGKALEKVDPKFIFENAPETAPAAMPAKD